MAIIASLRAVTKASGKLHRTAKAKNSSIKGALFCSGCTETISTSNKMTWLVLGGNGQLGQELINLLKTRNIEAIGTDQKEIDFTKPNELHRKYLRFQPQTFAFLTFSC